jgi:DNA-binding NarL/FixJ family response regulator
MARPIDTQLRILVVDDSKDYLEAVTGLLAIYPCVETVDQALSGAQALAAIRTGHPDLMLVDIAMPEISGLELTRTVKAAPHPPRVIIVTLHDTPAYREAARDAGADGFLGKSQLGERLQSAIRQIFPAFCLQSEAAPVPCAQG